MAVTNPRVLDHQVRAAFLSLIFWLGEIRRDTWAVSLSPADVLCLVGDRDISAERVRRVLLDRFGVTLPIVDDGDGGWVGHLPMGSRVLCVRPDPDFPYRSHRPNLAFRLEFISSGSPLTVRSWRYVDIVARVWWRVNDVEARYIGIEPICFRDGLCHAEFPFGDRL